MHRPVIFTTVDAVADPMKTLSSVAAGAQRWLLAGAQRKVFARRGGTCLQQAFGGYSCSVVLFDFDHTQTTTWKMQTQVSRIMLWLVMQQEIVLSTDNGAVGQLEEGFAYLLFLPGQGSSIIEFNKGHTRLVQVSIGPMYLEDLAPIHAPVRVLLDHMEKQYPYLRHAGRVRMAPGIFRQLELITSYTGNALHLRAFLHARVVDLVREYFEEHRRSAANTGMDFSERVLMAKKVIDENTGLKVSVGQVARKVGLARSDLQRGFRTLIGTTIDKYQAGVRLDRAAQLLVNEARLSVAEIGSRIGYSEESSFIRAFHKRFGWSPLRYRKRYTG